MNIKPIKTEQNYDEVLKRVESLMTAKPGTPECDELDILTTLIESYEREHYPIEYPTDSIEAIKFTMERKGLTVKDLVPFIGATNRVYEVLNKKRKLTLTMIKRLHYGLGIPADSLLT